jgi:hypothetical protein
MMIHYVDYLNIYKKNPINVMGKFNNPFIEDGISRHAPSPRKDQESRARSFLGSVPRIPGISGVVIQNPGFSGRE